MTGSHTAELPSWQFRLLERIHYLSDRYANLLRPGYPIYRPDDGRGEVTLQVWRSHLADLDTDRAELTARARAVGIPEHLITTAHRTGTHRLPLPIHPRTHPDPHHHWHLDALSDDVWALEHMTAVAIERHHRGLDTTVTESDHELANRFQHNMTTLSHRARTLAAAAGLDTTTAQAWGRDPAGWVQVFSHTVYRYSDTDLDIRYRMQAWPGVAWDADRVTGNLTFPDHAPETGLGQLWQPRQMLAQAWRARQADAATRTGVGRASPEHTVSTATEIAGPGGWGIDAIGDPPELPHTPDPAPEVGL